MNKNKLIKGNLQVEFMYAWTNKHHWIVDDDGRSAQLTVSIGKNEIASELNLITASDVLSYIHQCCSFHTGTWGYTITLWWYTIEFNSERNRLNITANISLGKE